MEGIPVVFFSGYLTLWCLLVVYDENLMRALNTTSLKCSYHQLMLLTFKGNNLILCMKVQGQLMQAHFIETRQGKKKKEKSLKI